MQSSDRPQGEGSETSAQEGQQPISVGAFAAEEAAPHQERVLDTPQVNASPSASVEEARASDLIYPPPPSYYERMQPAQPEPLPPPPRPALETAAPPAWAHGAATHLPPPARPLPAGAVRPPVVAAPHSRAWIWIVVIVLGGALLTSCGLCAWASSGIFSTVNQQLNAATAYYDNIQARHYEDAYRALAPEGSIAGLSEQQFITQAQGRDTQYGFVSSYTPQPSGFAFDANEATTARTTLQVDVVRSKLSYTVLLTVRDLGGGNWKVVDFDRI